MECFEKRYNLDSPPLIRAQPPAANGIGMQYLCKAMWKTLFKIPDALPTVNLLYFRPSNMRTLRFIGRDSGANGLEGLIFDMSL